MGEGAAVRSSQSKGWPSWTFPGCSPRERPPAEGKVSGAESKAGRAGRTGNIPVCHLEQTTLPQSGQASRHLPLETQASLFPPRKADTPAPRGSGQACL